MVSRMFICRARPSMAVRFSAAIPSCLPNAWRTRISWRAASAELCQERQSSPSALPLLDSTGI
jgi:hypothetical protein